MLKLQPHDNSQRQMHLHPALVATFLVAVATNDGEGPQLMDIAGWCCFLVQIYHDVEECSAKEIVESHLRPRHEIKEVKSAASRKKTIHLYKQYSNSSSKFHCKTTQI